MFTALKNKSILVRLFVGFVLIALASCGQKKSELIIGKWKIDDIITPVNFKNLDTAQKAQIQKDIQDHVAIQKAFGYYEFFPDGKAVSFDGKFEFKLRWRMNKEENILYLKPPDAVDEVEFVIETLEKTEFVLTKKDKDGELRIALVK
jgi:hypothetical protein